MQKLALADWKLPGQRVTVHINTDDDNDSKLQRVRGSGTKRPGPASRDASVAANTTPIQPQTKRQKEGSIKAGLKAGSVAELNASEVGTNAGFEAGLNAGSEVGINAGSEVRYLVPQAMQAWCKRLYA